MPSSPHKSGPKVCRFSGKVFIPVEFSDGAYRFGHAQVRANYDVNLKLSGVPIFPDLVGVCSVRAERQVDRKLLFEFAGEPPPQRSRRLSPKLVSALMRLPKALVGENAKTEFSSLASRDLYRCHSVALPSMCLGKASLLALIGLIIIIILVLKACIYT